MGVSPVADPTGSSDPAARPDNTEARPTVVRDRPRRVSWIPDQHGAWAFLLMPWLVGSALGGWSGASWLLLLAWLV